MAIDPLHVETSDVVVIGAGPAGAAAALAAASAGLSVTLLEESDQAGGQVYRALPRAFAVNDAEALGPEYAAGETLRAALRQSTIDCRFGRRVWLLRRDAEAGFVIDAACDRAAERYAARALILCTGTTERTIPFAGSAQPGVIGLAAATILLKSQKMLPGRRTLVAGSGPLLAAVAAGIVKGGGEVAAVVDLNGRADWAKAGFGMMGRPDLLFRGAGWMRMIRGKGVPWLWRHAITSAEGDETGVRVATVAPVDSGGHVIAGAKPLRFEVDAVTVGHGLVPATEFVRALDARLEWNADNSCWQPVKDDCGRTSVAGLYVAGDGAAVAGAAAAEVSGHIAGLAVAADMASGAGKDIAPQLRRKQRAAVRFGRASVGLTRLREGLVAGMPPQTVVCRCEDVTRATLDEAFREGARNIGQIKAWTRCGMGPCQGRMCGETLSALAATHGIARDTFSPMVGRSPARPVEIGVITGVPAYEDIPLPPSLPSS